MNVFKIPRRALLSLAALVALLAVLSFGANVWMVKVGASASAGQAKTITPTTLAKPDLVKRYQEMITADSLASRLTSSRLTC